MKNQLKKLELNKNLEIEMLENQLADWKRFNDQLQETCQNKDIQITLLKKQDNLHREHYELCKSESNKWQEYCNELKDMNLFQLILWKLKQ